MNRRHVLLGFSGLAVSCALTAGIVASGASDVAGVVAIILKRLGYLELDPQGVGQFAHEYVSRRMMSGGKLLALSAAKPLYDHIPQPWFDALTPRLPYAEDRLVTAFLLSSDFFPDADERRTVRYQGFFDAQLRGNPFARLRPANRFIQ